MPTVTIRGQLGSGAPQIGKLIAERMQGNYVDREIIAHMAEELRVEHEDIIAKEMPPGSFWGRLIEAFGRSYAISGMDLHTASMAAWDMPPNDAIYFEALQKLVNELAKRTNVVIRGRGSQFILKDNPNAWHFLITAPLETRVQRVMKENGVNEPDAKKDIERFDSSRRAFIRRHFNADLEDPVYYNLVVNTQRFTYEKAADIILEAMEFKEQGRSERRRLSKHIDGVYQSILEWNRLFRKR